MEASRRKKPLRMGITSPLVYLSGLQPARHKIWITLSKKVPWELFGKRLSRCGARKASLPKSEFPEDLALYNFRRRDRQTRRRH
jgi:hypothetical protein